MEIQVLRKQGHSLRQIAKEAGCAVGTVRKHLSNAAGAQGQQRYERKVKVPTKLAAYASYLRERVAKAKPHWLPATVLYREIAERGYRGGMSQLRAFLRGLKPVAPIESEIRFETDAGHQMQVDWVEFRRGGVGQKGGGPLYAFCATLGYSRVSHVEFVDNMRVDTLIACHERSFIAFGGVPRQALFDNMKTVVTERDHYGEGQHQFHAGFLDYARHAGFTIKLCRPYRAKTKGKVERFNGYLRRSFYVPLVTRLAQGGLVLDLASANALVATWLVEVAHERIHGTTGERPSARLLVERAHLQPLAPAWRGDVRAARPIVTAGKSHQRAPVDQALRAVPHTCSPNPLAVYAALLADIEAAVNVEGARV